MLDLEGFCVIFLVSGCRLSLVRCLFIISSSVLVQLIAWEDFSAK